MKTTRVLMILFSLLAVMFVPASAYAHCQVPCGIYDDAARVSAMLEDAETVAKAMRLIGELANKQDAQSVNQKVRWVMNKESHAQKIIATISDYFLTQRVKASQKDYVERLKSHHAVIVAAMKAKQNTDSSYAKELTRAIEALMVWYPVHRH